MFMESGAEYHRKRVCLQHRSRSSSPSWTHTFGRCLVPKISNFFWPKNLFPKRNWFVHIFSGKFMIFQSFKKIQFDLIALTDVRTAFGKLVLQPFLFQSRRIVLGSISRDKIFFDNATRYFEICSSFPLRIVHLVLVLLCTIRVLSHFLDPNFFSYEQEKSLLQTFLQFGCMRHHFDSFFLLWDFSLAHFNLHTIQYLQSITKKPVYIRIIYNTKFQYKKQKFLIRFSIQKIYWSYPKITLADCYLLLCIGDQIWG